MAPSNEHNRGGKSSRNDEGSVGAALRAYAPYLTLGFQLAAAVALFLVLGIWLDGRMETSPLFTLIGLFVGAVGGFIKFFRTIAELQKKKSNS